MNALNRKRTAQKAAEAEFAKYAQEYADKITQANVALFLCLLKKWGCKPDTIRKRYDDIKTGFELHEIFGKKVMDDDYIRQCMDEFIIDVKEVRTNVIVDFE